MASHLPFLLSSSTPLVGILDQIMATYFNATTIIVDDRDSSVHYEGDWYNGGTSDEYDDTTRGSKVGSPNCNFQFSFLGTAVEVFGTPATTPPVVNFQIDDLPAVIYHQPTVNVVTYGMLFYSSTTLDSGQHVLTGKVLNEQTLWLDYFLYTPSLPAPPVSPKPQSSSPLPPPVSRISPTSSLLSMSPPLPSSSTSTPPTNTFARSSVPVATIVGGTVGGLVALSTLLILIWWRRRRTSLALEGLVSRIRPPSPFFERRRSSPRPEKSRAPPIRAQSIATASRTAVPLTSTQDAHRLEMMSMILEGRGWSTHREDTRVPVDLLPPPYAGLPGARS